MPKPKALKQHPELDASVIHPSGICGPYDYAFGSVTCMVRDFVRGNMKMGIEGTFNSVDVRDLAEGVIILRCQQIVDKT